MNLILTELFKIINSEVKSKMNNKEKKLTHYRPECQPLELHVMYAVNMYDVCGKIRYVECFIVAACKE